MVDVANGTLRQLGQPRPAEQEGDVIHVDRAGNFLLLTAPVPGRETPGVYRIDLAIGTSTLAVAPQPHVWQWYADSAGVVRAGMAQQGDRSWLLYRKNENDGFSRSRRGTGLATSGVERVVPMRGSDRGYAMAETPGGRIGLYAYDFGNGRLGDLLFEDSRGDLDGFETDADGRLAGVALGAGVPRTQWFDARLAERQKAIDAALPGRVNRIDGASEDGARLLVRSESAGDPGSYYFYADGRAILVGAINPRLAGRAGSEMRAITYRARDGLEISGYLTLPTGREARGLPVIVMPHGMQSDLDDGLGWLAAQGIADAKRACIMGASYGGYAALWAATQDASPYRCAISFAGISDVKAQLDYDRKTFSERDFWRARIQGKARSLDSLSPLPRAARIRMPLLIAHGSVDEKVPPAQSIRLHAALTKLGRAHDYAAYSDEGHTLASPQANTDFLERIGKFLELHNPS